MLSSISREWPMRQVFRIRVSLTCTFATVLPIAGKCKSNGPKLFNMTINTQPARGYFHVGRQRHEFYPHQPAHKSALASIYRALLDPRAVATWKVPTGMTSHVHAFDAREGGLFRISLTYDEPAISRSPRHHRRG